MSKELSGYKGVVTTVNTTGEAIRYALLTYGKIQTIRNATIRANGLRNKFVFNVLLSSYRNPRTTEKGITKDLQANWVSVGLAVKDLVGKGFIRAIGKPRLIAPFQAYKIDTAYKITNEGYKVISVLLSGAGVIQLSARLKNKRDTT